MAGTITHKWNGTILTVTSDSGSSSCDLKGAQGDMGIRGPQGSPGVLVDSTGVVLADADNYYLKEEVDDAITASATELNNSINTLDSKLTMHEIEAANTISAQNKRLTNLEHWLAPRYFEEDDSTTYKKDVPEGALPYAEVNRVGGMTRKCSNLIPYPYYHSSRTSNGITWTVNQDGSITVNGTATAQSEFYLFSRTSAFIGKKVTISGGSAECKLVIINHVGSNAYDSGSGATNTPSGDIELWLIVSSGVTVNNQTIKPMLNYGATALPYEPYFEGLRDSKVTEIKSIGANLFDVSTAIAANGTISVDRDSINWNYGATAGDAFAFSCWVDVTPNTEYFLKWNSTSISTVYVYTDRLWGNLVATTSGSYSIKVGNNKRLLFAFYSSGTKRSGSSETISNIMLSKGKTALPYTLYVEHTLPIPEAVQALDGYGLGVNENCYNYIDWENKRFVKCVGSVDLGTLNWEYDANTFGGVFRTTLSTMKQNTAACVCSNYQSVDSNLASYDKAIYAKNNGNVVYVKDTDFTNVATFKAAMQGVMLVYELAEPIITDLSDLLSDDNFIEVEGGGIVMAVNEYNNATPTSITFQFKEGSV